MELLIASKGVRPQELDSRIRAARLLGHKEILLLFMSHDKDNGRIIESLKESTNRLVPAIVAKDQNHARQLRRSYAVVLASARRDMIECKAVTHILNPEQQPRQDFIHHRNSGMNQVLLKLCKRHDKELVTSLSALGTQPAVVLGRMMQNARWCKKYKVPYHVTSGARTLYEQRDADGLKALGRELLSQK